MKNLEFAKILNEIADLLEIKDVEWKPRAYRKAAQSIEALSEDIEEIYKNKGLKGLKEISGVGENIAKKIEEMLKTGKLKYFEELKKQIPVELEKIMSIPEMGPKKVKLFYQKLNIKTIKDLKKAALNKKIRAIKGFGEKTEQAILEGLKNLEGKQRILLGYALPIAREIESKLKNLREVKQISLAGSLRRMKETIGDIDILITSSNPKKVMNFFVSLGKETIMKGPTKSSIKLEDDIQVDLRVLSEESYGAALQYFTGSKEHNISLRKLAIKKGLKLSEYGVFRGKKRIAGKTEKEFYKALNLAYIEPEIREDNGEIEAAIKNKLPNLIGYNNIKGDLHVHTNYSDGNNTIEEIALAAKKLNYNYIAICDHASALKIAHGLDEKRLLSQIKEIDKINKKFNNFKILKGVEANILANGSIDLSRNVIKELDIVTAGIHSRFKSSKEEMTKRVLKTINNGLINVFTHPTGRLITRRMSYEIDLKKIFDAAKQNNVYLEVNSSPDRLDLKDVHVKSAIENKNKLVINTDSHSIPQLSYIELGIATARRGWATKKNVLNCLSLKELEKKLR